MTKKQLSKEEFEYVLDNKVESYHHQAECFKRLYSMNMLSYEAIKGTLVRVYTSSDWFDSSFFLSSDFETAIILSYIATAFSNS